MSQLHFIPPTPPGIYPPCRRCGGRDVFGAAYCLGGYCLNCRGREAKDASELEQGRQARRARVSEARHWLGVGLLFVWAAVLTWAVRAAGVLR